MKSSPKVIHWSPRIICILAILFISMFALDAFDPGLTFGQQLLGFTIHLIPSFVLVVFLVLAWKKEYLGGILFILIGLGFGPFIFFHNYNMNHSVWMSLFVVLCINLPFVLVGILFIVSHKMKQRSSSDSANE